MKTVLKLAAAAVAVVGMAGVAAAGSPGDFGPCPDGLCGTTASCANGKCGLAGCPNGQCGVTGCPNGQCGAGYGRMGAVSPYGVPRTAAAGYFAPATNPYYAGATSSCPGGNCPRAPVGSYAAGYLGYPTAANCPNGRCGVTPIPRYPATQRPLLSLLGLNW